MNQESKSPQFAWSVVYVSDVPRSTELYRSAFGLNVALELPSADYAEFDTGATALSLCCAKLAGESTGSDLTDRQAPTGNITLVVEDVDAAFEMACNNGAKPVTKPMTKPWGQRSSYVADYDGNFIELATRVTP